MEKTVYDQVHELLVAFPSTRGSDKILIKSYLKSVYGTTNLDHISDLPSFESITRCRRYIQRREPDLRATKKVTEERLNKTAKYIEFNNYGLLEDK